MIFGIIIFGTIMTVICIYIATRPDLSKELLIRFCQLPYFHPLEIAIRLGFGVIFIIGAAETKYPLFYTVGGYILLAIGAILAVTPPSAHRSFGIWAAEKFSPYFRLAAFFVFPLGVFIVYGAL